MSITLMERDVRRKLKGKPTNGTYPENRPSHIPTGRSIVEQFEDLSIVIIKHHGNQLRRLAAINKVQRHLSDLTDLPPASLQTYKTEACKQRRIGPE